MAKRKTGRGKGLTRGEQLRAAAGGGKPAGKGRGAGGRSGGSGTAKTGGRTGGGAKPGSRKGESKQGRARDVTPDGVEQSGGAKAGGRARDGSGAAETSGRTDGEATAAAGGVIGGAARDDRDAVAEPDERSARETSGGLDGGPDEDAPRGDAGRQDGAMVQGAEQRVFRLGAVAGATPGKWMQRWRRQVPGIELELVPITAAAQREALDRGEVDAAIVRLPLEGNADAVHVIGLYDEVPVVVASTESSLLAADELTPDDLDGEVLIIPADDVLGPLDLPTVDPDFPQLETTDDAIATAATGIGVVVVPMSLARLHHRRDVEFRPLVSAQGGAPLVAAPVGFAWLRDRDSEAVQAFVGITRGRTARSSR